MLRVVHRCRVIVLIVAALLVQGLAGASMSACAHGGPAAQRAASTAVSSHHVAPHAADAMPPCHDEVATDGLTAPSPHASCSLCSVCTPLPALPAVAIDVAAPERPDAWRPAGDVHVSTRAPDRIEHRPR